MLFFSYFRFPQCNAGECVENITLLPESQLQVPLQRVFQLQAC